MKKESDLGACYRQRPDGTLTPCILLSRFVYLRGYSTVDGWIKLHRSFRKWEWYQNDAMVLLFIHLLLSANHQENKWQGLLIGRGQLVTGLKSLNKETKISIRTLRTCLSRLEQTGEISRKSTNKYSIITINNYDKYQQNGCESDKQPTSNRQATDNKQECKEYKNNNIPFSDIISYLNLKAGTKYRTTTKVTVTKIRARWNEGFRLDDFKKVIDVKTEKWLRDPKMEQYLRPETLFGTKFESYLNEPIPKKYEPY